MITFWGGEGGGMNLDHTYEAGSLKLISWKVSSVIPATLAFLFPLRFGYETSKLRTPQCAMKAMLMIIWCLENLKTWANFEQDFHVRKMEVESWINSSTFFLIHKWKIQKDAEQFTPNINCSPKITCVSVLNFINNDAFEHAKRKKNCTCSVQGS